MDSEDAFPGNGTTTATTSFQADETGTYVVSLTVQDENGSWSERFGACDHHRLQAPTAAGEDVDTIEGETVTLDETGSYDPMGRDLSYMWSFQAVPSSARKAQPISMDTTLQHHRLLSMQVASTWCR